MFSDNIKNFNKFQQVKNKKVKNKKKKKEKMMQIALQETKKNTKNIGLILSFLSLFTLFCLMFVINFVYLASAASAFSVKSNVLTNVVCPSSTIVIEEKVRSDKNASFEVKLSGTASSFATALPSAFYMDAGEEKSVYVYITPSTNVLPGNYYISVLFSNGKESKELKHEIVVENCNRISVTIVPEKEKKVCACESTTYRASIKNNGIYKERYKIELGGNAAEFMKLSTDSISLSPKESRDILLYFSPDCTQKAKDYSFNLKVTSLDSKEIGVVEGSITVVNCYSYSLDAEKNYISVCDGEDAEAKVLVQNIGVSENSYDVVLKGPGFSYLNKDSLTLKAGEKGEIKISLKPKLGEKEGNYSLEVKTLSVKGNIMGKEKIIVEIKECHGAQLKLEKKKDKICEALTNNYGTELINIGEKEGNYRITLQAPEWARINSTEAKLKAKESKIINLEVSPPYKTEPKKYTITLKAKDINSEVEISESLELEVLSKDDCYRPKIMAKEEKIEVERDKTYVVILTIENTGARKANYIIENSGSANRFVSVTPSIISLAPQKASTIYLYIAPTATTPNGSYVVTITARLNDTTALASLTLNIDVVDKKTLVEEKEPTLKELEIQEKEIQEKSEKLGFWQKIKEWFRKVFGGSKEEKIEKELEQIELEQISKISNVSNITKITNNTTTKNVSQENMSKQAQQQEQVQQQQQQAQLQEQEQKNKSFLEKFRWYIIGSLILIIIIAILFLFDVFEALKKRKKKAVEE